MRPAPKRTPRNHESKQLVGPQINKFPCIFCHRKFATGDDARKHERDYHAKRLKKLTEETGQDRSE